MNPSRLLVGAEAAAFPPDREKSGPGGRIPSAAGRLPAATAVQGYFSMTDSPSRYTCHEYREEMLLLGLRRRLADDSLSSAEKEALQKAIAELEKQMGMA
jgi:hypothetical protein